MTFLDKNNKKINKTDLTWPKMISHSLKSVKMNEKEWRKFFRKNFFDE